ncbi:hypothetical protein FP2506_10921 [Fulvimarina pelagi HTCC2506]|uniref:Ribosome modulation factor n=1 Tax=Fulvimarina pelagi HTCC2506 TaxID=314231 RepID=Q0G4R2_9HYPH|nr:Rmf/CrpP family protein [Fulvimarina pelagi]EAU43352.1 hypothetical protein FP2506_10921 [Fulvimarina pelagi HTCC2506]
MSTSAFDQGKLAYKANLPMSACEYPRGSKNRTEWMAGWTQLRRNDEGKIHPEPQAGMMTDLVRSTTRAPTHPRQG